MNTKIRIKNLRTIAPDYPRIPHLDKSISTMTHDDIVTETGIQFPLECWVQEKVDGANLGVSWTSAPVLRNRNNILKKGYIEKGYIKTTYWLHLTSSQCVLSKSLKRIRSEVMVLHC